MPQIQFDRLLSVDSAERARHAMARVLDALVSSNVADSEIHALFCSGRVVLDVAFADAIIAARKALRD